MRLLAIALVLLSLAAPLALAQKTNPVVGSYQDTYVVAGRVVDQNGVPTVNATVTATLSEPGVKASPVSGYTNCNGDFELYYTLDDIKASGTVTVTVNVKGLSAPATNTTSLDPFYRRTDLRLVLPASLPAQCADPHLSPYNYRVTITGRVVNRTATYSNNSGTYDATPYGPRLFSVLLYYFPPGREGNCPPGTNGGCERVDIDERGDFKYTYTYNDVVPGNGTFLVRIEGHNFTIRPDPVTRIAQLHVDMSGRGPPAYAPAKTPWPPLAPALAAVVGLALVRRFMAQRRG